MYLCNSHVPDQVLYFVMAAQQRSDHSCQLEAAPKAVCKLSFFPPVQESFRKEIRLLQSCNHDNIVGFRAACLDAPGHLMLVRA